MENYKDSDYALNKYSGGIVYRFADGIKEVTLADFLAENPGMPESDFRKFKNLSDDIYLGQARDVNTQTNKNIPFEKLEGTSLCRVQSPEDHLMDALDALDRAKGCRERSATAKRVLDKLTDIQLRRYYLRVVNGLNEREIAELEHTTQQAVSKSLLSSEKKIKKFIASS